jgi:hypothetical protein
MQKNRIDPTSCIGCNELAGEGNLFCEKCLNWLQVFTVLRARCGMRWIAGSSSPALTGSAADTAGARRSPSREKADPCANRTVAQRHLAQWSEARPKSLPVQRKKGHDHCAKPRGLLAQWSADKPGEDLRRRSPLCVAQSADRCAARSAPIQSCIPRAVYGWVALASGAC